MSDDGVLRWGSLTDVSMRLQFPHSKFDRLSLATTPIEVYSESERLGHATGFFWRNSNEVWLITNWHCVTGNNPFTKRVLHSNRPAPFKLTYYMLRLNTTEGGALHFPTRYPMEQLLFDDGVPVWQQHKDFAKSGIDVVAFRILESDATDIGKKVSCVNDAPFPQLFHHVGADLFVVGYPIDNFDGWMPPIWKRASFAGEPILPMSDKPLFPLDVMSTEGMSGSPVFRRVFGPKATPNGAEVALDNIVATEFVGVYAGRLTSKELDRVGIGYSWYGYTVDEIVSAGEQGTTC